MRLPGLSLIAVVVLASARVVSAQPGCLGGVVRDETSAALPGVTVELRDDRGSSAFATTDSEGAYRFTRLASGRYTAVFTLLNFAAVRRDISVSACPAVLDIVLHLALNADVTVI